jgi:hypothetical protein
MGRDIARMVFVVGVKSACAIKAGSRTYTYDALPDAHVME